MTATSANSMTLTLGDFPFQAFDKLRYGDTDRQGHVNNAVFSTFLETGRAEFLLDPDLPLLEPGCALVIADLSLQLLAEVNWPGQVDIGTAVLKVGNSSVTLYQHLYQNDRCVATATTVIVQMNEETRRSHPLSESTKQFLTQHLIAQDLR